MEMDPFFAVEAATQQQQQEKLIQKKHQQQQEHQLQEQQEALQQELHHQHTQDQGHIPQDVAVDEPMPITRQDSSSDAHAPKSNNTVEADTSIATNYETSTKSADDVLDELGLEPNEKNTQQRTQPSTEPSEEVEKQQQHPTETLPKQSNPPQVAPPPPSPAPAPLPESQNPLNPTAPTLLALENAFASLASLLQTNQISQDSVIVFQNLIRENYQLKEKISKLKNLLQRSAKAQKDSKAETSAVKKELEVSQRDVGVLRDRMELLVNRPSHLDILADFESQFDRALISLGGS
eukprot:CAMPEP_0194420752 /NCGR_PEP_ID=MMETSP0176-20130528/20035_1 /TAXON_ID=216777 /ORGANISM="Proboscia alata, Strain PI-D3" /LENGTH=292 /DNA_ID=CAMNT_0039228535 /DNA_START=108 /DNA_END=983 /DNA_ORIENTATION=-